jgi:hypothetical protein
MKCLSTFFGILPLALVACLPTALHAAVIINGGFEEPDLSRDTWIEHAFTFTATASTMALNVNVTRQLSGGGNIPGLDNIQITEGIPEPSCTGLLLLGALAMNRRLRILA